MRQATTPPEPPPRRLRIAFLVLCAIGACLSADLIRLHVKVHTDPDYHSYCAISERVDCETVAQSPHAVFAGLPTAVWGMLGYLLLGSLAVMGLARRLPVGSWPFGLLFWLSALCVVTSVWLFAVTLFVVRSTCIVCAGTYVVNLFLLALAAAELRGRGSGPLRALRSELAAVRERPRSALLLSTTFVALATVAWLSVPPYWNLGAATGPGGLSVGQTKDGHWWIGARDPVLEIVEFSDYQCPFCQRGHAGMRRLIEREPERVRLVHRQYPLDQSCNTALRKPLHPHACRYAAMAYCAGEQKRFWEGNDFLLANGRREQPLTVEEVAVAIGIDALRFRACLDSDGSRAAVLGDLAAGRDLKVGGTPTFLVNGRTYPGAIPDEVIQLALKGNPADRRP